MALSPRTLFKMRWQASDTSSASFVLRSSTYVKDIDADQDKAIVITLVGAFGLVNDEITLPPSIELRARDLSL